MLDTEYFNTIIDKCFLNVNIKVLEVNQDVSRNAATAGVLVCRLENPLAEQILILYSVSTV